MAMKKLIGCAAVLLALCGCKTQIQHGLDERQANELQTVLVEHGIEARKVVEEGKKPTWAIEVEEDRATESVRILADLGLPRPKAEGFDEVFGKGSLVPTATEERVRYQEALSGELAKTLESFDGVASARVHLVVSPQTRPGQAPVASKASAFLRVRPGKAERIRAKKAELQALIAGSVDGLSASAVTVVVDEVAMRSVPVAPHTPFPWMRVAAAAGGLATLIGLALLALGLKSRRKGKAKKPAPVAVPQPARKAA
jgi:type III secretion protein J